MVYTHPFNDASQLPSKSVSQPSPDPASLLTQANPPAPASRHSDSASIHSARSDVALVGSKLPRPVVKRQPTPMPRPSKTAVPRLWDEREERSRNGGVFMGMRDAVMTCCGLRGIMTRREVRHEDERVFAMHSAVTAEGRAVVYAVDPSASGREAEPRDEGGVVPRDGNVVSVAAFPSSASSFHRKQLLPPLEKRDMAKKTLVLDLDETLVRSAFRPVPNPDYQFPVEIMDTDYQCYVLARPYALHFLAALAVHFEIVLFTASLASYADPLLDLMDTGGWIRHRLYREDCTPFQGNFVKDLKLLGRPLEDVIIVDNSPASYMFHPENALPCTSWYSDKADKELLELISILMELKDVEDAREGLKRHVNKMV